MGAAPGPGDKTTVLFTLGNTKLHVIVINEWALKAYADRAKAKAMTRDSIDLASLTEWLLGPLERKQKQNLLDGLHRFILWQTRPKSDVAFALAFAFVQSALALNVSFLPSLFYYNFTHQEVTMKNSPNLILLCFKQHKCILTL